MKLYFWLFLTLAFLVSCATTSAEKKQRAEVHLRMGTAHLQNGNYPSALKELLTAESLDTNNPIIHNNLALAYYVRDRFEDSEKHLKQALELNPKYSDARNNLGRVYISQKQYDNAITELLTVTNDLTYPSPEKAFANLALAYYRKSEFSKARDAALIALKNEKSFCPAQSTYGLSLFYLEDFKKAAQSFERTAAQCEREKEEAQYYSALSHYKLGSKERAVARLQELLASFPEGEYAEKAKTMLGILK